MKTERRHELQTNVLADWLGKHLEQTQSYSKVIVGVLLLAAAAVVAGTYITRDQASRNQLSWNAYYQALGQRNAEALEDMAQSHAGTSAAVWARQAEADILLADGINALYTSRDRGKELLQQATQAYAAVEAAATDRLLKERAWFGLGQAHESLAELDKARDYYERIASGSPDSALGKEAKRRADSLSDPATEKWYNWFANQKARPPLPGLDRLPGLSDLPDLGSLPDRPDLPASTASLPPAGPSPKEPAPEGGAAEATVPSSASDSTPAAAPPAEPSSSEPPPAEPPAESANSNQEQEAPAPSGSSDQ